MQRAYTVYTSQYMGIYGAYQALGAINAFGEIDYSILRRKGKHLVGGHEHQEGRSLLLCTLLTTLSREVESAA